MIAMGCKYLRICHLNNCATGVATQRDDLINHHFVGEKERVMNYFKFIAEDVRNHLSIMGISKLEDIIGQTQYLETIKGLDKQYKSIDLNDVDYFLLPDHIKKFQIETLNCLNIPEHKRISSCNARTKR